VLAGDVAQELERLAEGGSDLDKFGGGRWSAVSHEELALVPHAALGEWFAKRQGP